MKGPNLKKTNIVYVIPYKNLCGLKRKCTWTHTLLSL